MRRPTHMASAAFAAAALLMTAACGAGSSSGPTAEGSGGSGNSGIPAVVQAHYDKGIGKGSYQDPETSTKPDPGKRITAITYGNQSIASPIYTDALKQAAQVAGWDVNVVDGKFSSSTYVDAIQQAIAEKVDGIALYVIDCAGVKAAAQQAKAAGIPIIFVEAQDCGASGSKEATGYQLSLANTIEGKPVDYATFFRGEGAIQADAAIVAQKGNVNALALNFPESTAVQSQTDGFLEEMKLCSSCTTKVMNLRFADFGSGIQQKVSTALLQNPKINTIFGNYDDPVVNGVIQAVQSSGRKDIYITGEAGYPAMLQAIHDGKAQMTSGYDVALEGWATVERFNRIFHGDAGDYGGTGNYNQGLGIQIVTADHNLPAGDQYVAPIDYPGIFTKAWTGQ